VARVSLWIGLVLTLVGSIARWGSLAVGLTLLALALGLALLDEIATYHRERQRAPEPEEVEE